MTGQAEVRGKGMAGGGGCVNKDLVAGRCFSGWSIEFVLGCVWQGLYAHALSL